MSQNPTAKDIEDLFINGIGIRQVLGFVFAFIGVVMAIWLFSEVYELLTSPQKLTAFQKLVSQTMEGSLSTGDSRVKLVIPPEILAYLIPILLLGIGARIAGMLITGGLGFADGADRKPSLISNERSK